MKRETANTATNTKQRTRKMGNRAVITRRKDLKGVGIYLHWNGGRDSVEAFLAYCNLKGYRGRDDEYGMAMLVNVITNFFENGLSCGIGIAEKMDCDNYDNGVFFIGDEWNIVGRKFAHGEQYGHDLLDMIKKIDEKQPRKMRLTEKEWERFEEVKAKTIAAREV